jgi:hypothetical protein
VKTLLRYGLALSLVAVLPLVVRAGGCGYLSNYSYGYNSYYTPYYKTVYYAEIVPTPVALFQFVAPAVTTTTVTTQTTAAAVGVSGVAGSSVAGAAVAAPAATGAVAQTSMVSDAQIRLLAVELAKALKGDTGPAAAPPPKPADKPQSAAPSQQERLVLEYKAAAIAASKCMSCHTQGSEKGKVFLFNTQGSYGPNVDYAKISEVLESDRMPMGKDAHKCTPEEKTIFRQLKEATKSG